jgi:predicted nuclease with RNAse H fold
VPPIVRILGIDLASDPRRTAACSVDWNGTIASVRELREPVDDETAVALASVADLVAIDAPLDWPVAFGEAIAKHQRRETWPASSVRDLSYRRSQPAY